MRRALALLPLLAACGARSAILPGAGGAPATTTTASTTTTSPTTTATTTTTGAPVACPTLRMFPPLYEVATAGVDMVQPVAVSLRIPVAPVLFVSRGPTGAELWSANVPAWDTWPPPAPAGVATLPLTYAGSPLPVQRAHAAAAALHEVIGAYQLATSGADDVSMRASQLGGQLADPATVAGGGDVLAVAAQDPYALRLALMADDEGRIRVIRSYAAAAPAQATTLGCVSAPAAADLLADDHGYIVAVALASTPVWGGDEACTTLSPPTRLQVARITPTGELAGSWTTIDPGGEVARVRLSPVASGGAWLAWTRRPAAPPAVVRLDASLNLASTPGWSTGANVADPAALALAPLGDGAVLATLAHVAGTDTVDVFHVRDPEIGLDSVGIFPGTVIAPELTVATRDDRALVVWSESQPGLPRRVLRMAGLYCDP